MFTMKLSSILLILTLRLKSMFPSFFSSFLTQIIICAPFFEMYFLNLFFVFCSVRVIDIDGRWITLGELANCVKGVGQLSTSIAELHVRFLQYKETPNRLIFPWVLSVYLLIGDFKSKCLLKYFRRDKFYILSHQDQVCYVCWIW